MEKYTLSDLLYLMSRLRDPDGGCPWDLEQDFESITSSTIEEAYELVDAIMTGDMNQIREELGDVLFQVVFYSQLGKEQQAFEFDDIVHSIADKLVRRHPHVFPDGNLHKRFDKSIDVAQVKQQWEAIKQEERDAKQKKGVLDDIPQALPALSRAQKMQKRVSRVGFDWPDAIAAFEKLEEEISELKQAIADSEPGAMEEELGDLLFSCVNIARHLGLDAEKALASANRKFESRFDYVESNLREQGKSLEEASLMEMDEAWEKSKQ